MKNSPLREIPCAICGESFLTKFRGKYCSARCRAKVQRNLYRQNNPVELLLSPSTTGIISEYQVIVDLLQKGYEVFHAASPATSCDLAILKDGHLLRVEVKTALRSATGRFFKPPIQILYDKTDIVATVMPNEIIYDPKGLVS